MAKNKTVTNTTTQERTILDGMPGVIEASEKRGQDEFVGSDVLPVDGSNDKAIQVLGIKFGPTCQDDPIFRKAKLPEGWKKIPTDHSMWSDIVDENGNKKASVFYKAAFYDRSARIHPVG